MRYFYEKILLLLFIAVIGLGVYLFLTRKKQIKRGTIIILNGPSASGKTSIQKEFQTLVMPNL